MAGNSDAELVLHALPDPAFLVEANGKVVFANHKAVKRLGREANSGRDLATFCPGPEARTALQAYLRRCAGSREPLPGSLELRDEEGRTSRFRCHANLLHPARGDERARLLLRLSDGGDDRFSALTHKVRELNDEIRSRRRAQALLEEALRDRNILLRELHHRVKNNIQMLASMLAVARRDAMAPEAVSILGDASRRLAAIGAVHQMLYQGASFRGVNGSDFITKLGTMVAEAGGAAKRLVVEAESLEIPNDAAVPLALALNELVTNALKHGLLADGTPGRVTVGLATVGDAGCELWVEDEGPGFDVGVAAGRRASGLGLVSGLARQIGGAFSVGRGANGGARCTIRFRITREPAQQESSRA